VSKPTTVALVTLGCARNDVDSEELAGRLAATTKQKRIKSGRGTIKTKRKELTKKTTSFTAIYYNARDLIQIRSALRVKECKML